MPYLTWAPSAWVLPLKFSGGGLSAMRRTWSRVSRWSSSPPKKDLG
jgi:hypothetical protein